MPNYMCIHFLSFQFQLFDSIYGQHGEIEIPELVQETPQGGLVWKLADQESLTIGLRFDGDVTEPVSHGWTQGFFEPDTICGSLLYSFSAHNPCTFSFKNECIL
jgi:hypothetical protein